MRLQHWLVTMFLHLTYPTTLQLTGSNYEAPVAGQWESVGPPGRSGNRERWTGGDWREVVVQYSN